MTQTRMIGIALALSLWFAPAARCLAQDQLSPFEFKGVPLGSAESALIGKHSSFRCRQGDGLLADRTCTMGRVETCGADHACQRQLMELMTYAGAPVDTFRADFYEGHLSRLTILTHVRHFAAIVGVLGEAHGKATSVESKAVQNRAGATFSNEVIYWRRTGSEVRAERYYIDLETSAIIIRVSTATSEFAKRRAAKAKGATKDL
jgi:hypothetical protein